MEVEEGLDGDNDGCNVGRRGGMLCVGGFDFGGELDEELDGLLDMELGLDFVLGYWVKMEEDLVERGKLSEWEKLCWRILFVELFIFGELNEEEK